MKEPYSKVKNWIKFRVICIIFNLTRNLSCMDAIVDGKSCLITKCEQDFAPDNFATYIGISNINIHFPNSRNNIPYSLIFSRNFGIYYQTSTRGDLVSVYVNPIVCNIDACIGRQRSKRHTFTDWLIDWLTDWFMTEGSLQPLPIAERLRW